MKMVEFYELRVAPSLVSVVKPFVPLPYERGVSSLPANPWKINREVRAFPKVQPGSPGKPPSRKSRRTNPASRQSTTRFCQVSKSFVKPSNEITCVSYWGGFTRCRLQSHYLEEHVRSV